MFDQPHSSHRVIYRSWKGCMSSRNENILACETHIFFPNSRMYSTADYPSHGCCGRDHVGYHKGKDSAMFSVTSQTGAESLRPLCAVKGLRIYALSASWLPASLASVLFAISVIVNNVIIFICTASFCKTATPANTSSCSRLTYPINLVSEYHLNSLRKIMGDSRFDSGPVQQR
jgi:hypothetical protein